jgi:hypothetical protein
MLQQLPSEILNIICKYLLLTQITCLSTVSKIMRQITTQDHLWHRIRDNRKQITKFVLWVLRNEVKVNCHWRKIQRFYDELNTLFVFNFFDERSMARFYQFFCTHEYLYVRNMLNMTLNTFPVPKKMIGRYILTDRLFGNMLEDLRITEIICPEPGLDFETWGTYGQHITKLKISFLMSHDLVHLKKLCLKHLTITKSSTIYHASIDHIIDHLPATLESLVMYDRLTVRQINKLIGLPNLKYIKVAMFTQLAINNIRQRNDIIIKIIKDSYNLWKCHQKIMDHSFIDINEG